MENEMPAEVRAYIDGLIDATADPELRKMVRTVMEPAIAAFWGALRETMERAISYEREECAKVADGFGTDPAELAHPCDIAAAIRARK